MKDPGFIVVGAARAGTTALHHYLRQHPGIFLPAQKEPCFFCFAGSRPKYRNGKFAFAVTDQSKYIDLYKQARPGMLTGDISTPYLYLHEPTIANIRYYHDDPAHVKIVILLRNPIERAYSQYMWKVRDGREPYSFDDALRFERKRMQMNYSFDYFYAHRGLYYDQVKDFMDNFPQTGIFLYEDFKNNFESTMSRLCSFLGVDDYSFEKRKPVNVSGQPRFATLGKLVTMESRMKFRMLSYLPEDFRLGMKERFQRWNSLKKKPPGISTETRRRLLEYYREDIQKLQQLTGIELSHWMQEE